MRGAHKKKTNTAYANTTTFKQDLMWKKFRANEQKIKAN